MTRYEACTATAMTSLVVLVFCRCLIFDDMNSMLMAFNHLVASDDDITDADLHPSLRLGVARQALKANLPRVRIVRVKNRLLENATDGGWSDVLVNLCIERCNSISTSGTGQAPMSIVCELQLIHLSMFNIRHRLRGHHTYAMYRTAAEVLAWHEARDHHQSSPPSSPSPMQSTKQEWVEVFHQRMKREKVDVVDLKQCVELLISKKKQT